ncbi:STAS domain-containing protein [Jatrophihabitans sp. YIM 134969]
MTIRGADPLGKAEAPGVLRVDAVGDLDLATAEKFLTDVVSQLPAWPLHRVEVDMSRVEFIDSTGLGALVELRRAAFAHGADTKLVNAGHRTERLLQIVGLDTTFL